MKVVHLRAKTSAHLLVLAGGMVYEKSPLSCNWKEGLGTVAISGTRPRPTEYHRPLQRDQHIKPTDKPVISVSRQSDGLDSFCLTYGLEWYSISLLLVLMIIPLRFRIHHRSRSSLPARLNAGKEMVETSLEDCTGINARVHLYLRDSP